MEATLARCQADIDAFNASSSGDENLAADPPSFRRDRRTVALSAAEMAHDAELDLRTAGFHNRSEEQIQGEKRRNRASQLDTEDAFFTKRYDRSALYPAADELVDSARPLSSTTARNTQVRLDAAAAADEATHRRAVVRNYVFADPKKFSRVTAYPWPVGADST
ncbi:unnamed protein product, partial [Scytosiphon promiscuus]